MNPAKVFQVSSFLPIALLLFLSYSNPRDKDRYISFMTRQTNQLMCRKAVGGWCAEVCVATRPLMQPLTWGLFALYTERPKDYLVFTVFQTHLPGMKLDVIGIAGMYLFVPIDLEIQPICELIRGVGDYYPITVQQPWETLGLAKEVTAL